MGRETLRHRKGSPTQIRVVDEGYIMGQLEAPRLDSFPFSRGAVWVRNRWGSSMHTRHLVGDKWAGPFGHSPVPVCFGDNGVRYFPCLKLGTRQICVAARAVDGEDVRYLVFPDFRITEEKLGPVLDRIYRAGVREIEYSALRRLLDM